MHTRCRHLALLALLGCLLGAPGMAGAVGAREPETVPQAIGDWECWAPGDANPCHYRLSGADALATDDVWAVGDGILHWDGTAWTSVPNPAGPVLVNVDMLAADDGWEVPAARRLGESAGPRVDHYAREQLPAPGTVARPRRWTRGRVPQRRLPVACR